METNPSTPPAHPGQQKPREREIVLLQGASTSPKIGKIYYYNPRLYLKKLAASCDSHWNLGLPVGCWLVISAVLAPKRSSRQLYCKSSQFLIVSCDGMPGHPFGSADLGQLHV
jgi:hypothetical protein